MARDVEKPDEVGDDRLAAVAVVEEPTAGPAPPLTVVGIGASAGGLEALSAMIKHLELDHTAFVVVQHLAPAHESLLAELLARSTSLRVVTITDGMVVEPNHIYVIPPNSDLAVLHDVLHLLPPPATRGPRLAIDFFFRSLAADKGASAIGVILSGAGTDGTFGLQAIKAEGGITFVQDPGTARYDGMPRSALDSGYADFSLAPEELGREVSRLSRHPYLARQAASGSAQLHEYLGKIFILIRKEFGHDLTFYKPNTIERRIERRMALHRIERLPDYLKYLQSNPRELGTLYKDILINVTSFFRDQVPFEALKSEVLPRLLAGKKPGDAIRFWAAGCATGEEAYSLAMSLLETLGDRAADFKIQVFGTDVDGAAIQQARHGSYPQNIALDVSPERLHRFFRRQDDGYRVSRAVRDMLIFSTQNLTKDAPFSRIDLVTCRNLLIYLQPVLQKKVLRILHYALNPEGILMLGTSETVGDSPDLFALMDRKNKVYRKKNITSAASFEIGGGVPPDAEAASPPRPAESRPSSVQQLAERRLLERYVPPGVLLNENLDIVQFRGRTAPYLEAAPGAASLHIFKHTRVELQAELRAALERARAEDRTVSSPAVPLQDKERGQLRSVIMDVVPVHEPGAREGCFMVLFRDEQAASAAPPADDVRPSPVPEDGRMQQLERELAATREYLQGTIEELETSNEELKSSNEELQSSNEELQSTNEEMETSKEELQSSNEELTTVNDELQNRMSELSLTKDDLANLMAGLDSAVLFVGPDLRIRRFSKGAEKLLDLVGADVGRTLGHLAAHVRSVDVEKVTEEVVARAASARHDVVIGQRWYTMHAVPYMTSDRAIRGAMLSFTEIDEKTRRLDQALAGAHQASLTLMTMTHPLLMLDEKMRVIWANAAFYDTFGATPDQTLGDLMRDLGDKQWAHPRLVELVQKTIASGQGFKSFSLTYDFGSRGQRTMRVGASVITGPAHPEQRLILVVIEEEQGATEEPADGSAEPQ